MMMLLSKAYLSTREFSSISSFNNYELANVFSSDQDCLRYRKLQFALLMLTLGFMLPQFSQCDARDAIVTMQCSTAMLTIRDSQCDAYDAMSTMRRPRCDGYNLTMFTMRSSRYDTHNTMSTMRSSRYDTHNAMSTMRRSQCDGHDAMVTM